MKYIFVAGAPGSKWSSVVKNIYWSSSIDASDYADNRVYYHDASGRMDLMHLGAYFDPGMEFGDWFEQLDRHSKEQCEKEFDRPFRGSGVRIIKSHVFAHHVDFIKATWPDCPMILVHRPDDAALGWWVKCGHFDITYPDYSQYYVDLRRMAAVIARQNRDIESAINRYPKLQVLTNVELAQVLGIVRPPQQYFQNYLESDIEVSVI